MLKHELYEKAYEILENITPLKYDCGKLCNGACCDSADEDAGMYLFPGEESMYTEKPDWLRIEQSDFTYGEENKALIAICKGQCDRKLRPLACRIFPLTPYIGHDVVLEIKKDPRAVPVCPLAVPYADKDIDKGFIHAVNDAFEILAKDEEIHSFIYSLSRLIDEHESLFLLFTTGQRKKRRRRAIRRR